MAFYERFEWLCEDKGVTPTQAARDVGIRQSVVSMWKKRGSTPSGKTLNKLAEYFEVSTDYLLGKVIDAKKTGSAAGLHFMGPMGGDDTLDKVRDIAYRPIIPFTPENMAAMAREHILITSFRKLNIAGQNEAAKRVEELTEIRRYQAQPPAGASPASPKDTDTPAAQDAPEGLQKPEEGV